MKKIILLAAAVVAFAGCKKFLEPRSQTQYIPSKVEQLEELILSALPDPSSTGTRALTGGFLDIMTDDVQTHTTIRIINPLTHLWYDQGYVTAVRVLYTWQGNYSDPDAWGAFKYTGWSKIYENTYTKLVYVNSILDYVDQVEGTEYKKNYLKAQAYALRAFYYLNLVNIYGEPYSKGLDGQGIPLRTTGAKENRKMTRNTVGEVYARIEQDLLDAIDLFEDMEMKEQDREWHPTMPMALLLAARTYLYMGDWEQAEHYAQKLIDDWSHEFEVMDLNQLIEDGYTNDDPSNPGSQRFWEHFKTYSNDENIWVYGAAYDLVELTGQDLRQGAALQNNVYPMLTLASDDLVGSYEEDDLRRKTYLVRNLYDNSGEDHGSYRAYAKMAISQDASGMADGGNYRFLPLTNATDFGYSLRISEAWLILAEALAEQGDTGGALAALDEVQSKRVKDGVIPAKYRTGDIVDMVREERRREFCFEGMRWSDLRRWGMPRIEHVWYNTTIGSQSGTEMKYVLEQGDPGYTLPIPEDIMGKNQDLTPVPTVNNRQPQ